MARSKCVGFGVVLLSVAMACAMGDDAPEQKKHDQADRLNAGDAPYVQGKVILRRWQNKHIVCGFVGKGTDGKEYTNLAGTTLHPGLGTCEVTSTTKAPQLTSVSIHSTGGVEFRHVKLAPGDYLFYVRLGHAGAMAAWEQVTVKPGDQLTVDLRIDPARMGNLVATLPDEEASDEEDWPLSLIPILPNFDCSRLCQIAYFQAAKVDKGQRTVTVKHVPAGKYRALRGRSMALVEVTAGQETAITLVLNESKKR